MRTIIKVQFLNKSCSGSKEIFFVVFWFFGYKGDKLYFASEAWMLKDLGVKKWHSLSRGEIRVYSADGFVASSEVEEARRGYGYSRGKVVYYDDYEEDDDKDKRRFAKYVWDFWGW